MATFDSQNPMFGAPGGQYLPPAEDLGPDPFAELGERKDLPEVGMGTDGINAFYGSSADTRAGEKALIDSSGFRFRGKPGSRQDTRARNREGLTRAQVIDRAGSGEVPGPSKTWGERAMSWLQETNSPQTVLRRIRQAHKLRKDLAKIPGQTSTVWKPGARGPAPAGAKSYAYENLGKGVEAETDGTGNINVTGLTEKQAIDGRNAGIAGWRNREGLSAGNPATPGEFEDAWKEMSLGAKADASKIGQRSVIGKLRAEAGRSPDMKWVRDQAAKTQADMARSNGPDTLPSVASQELANIQKRLAANSAVKEAQNRKTLAGKMAQFPGRKLSEPLSL